MEINYYLAASLILLGICIYTNINLLLKVEALRDRNDLLNDQIADTSQRITNTLTNMQRIDSKGGFESDDEVGSIFDALKNELKTLSEL